MRSGAGTVFGRRFRHLKSTNVLKLMNRKNKANGKELKD
jgi:hypothetical protein